MEKKNRHHPYVKLGELYTVVSSTVSWMPAGTVVKVYDGAVHGDFHLNQLYFVSIEEVYETSPSRGHTGARLEIVPYVKWEDLAREMLG